jgi:hypothetical protein
MKLKYTRVGALALFLYLAVSPTAIAAPRDRNAIGDPIERVVRVVKKVKNFFRGYTSQEDGHVPPIPKP